MHRILIHVFIYNRKVSSIFVVLIYLLIWRDNLINNEHDNSTFEIWVFGKYIRFFCCFVCRNKILVGYNIMFYYIYIFSPYQDSNIWVWYDTKLNKFSLLHNQKWHKNIYQYWNHLCVSEINLQLWFIVINRICIPV